MAEEKKSIFRKESLDRISSPEEYDQFLKVTGPGVWIVLGCVVVLLAGAIIWAIFGRLDTTMQAAVVSKGDAVVCVVPETSLEAVMKGKMKIEIAGEVYDLKDTGRASQVLTSDSAYAELLSVGYPQGTVIAILDVSASLSEGVYVGKIQVEQVSPISFIVN